MKNIKFRLVVVLVVILLGIIISSNVVNANTYTFISLDYPGAIRTEVHGIDGGNIVGEYMDANGYHGFLYDGTTWRTLDYPGSPTGWASDIDAGNIVGSYVDGTGIHGFLYDGTIWSTLDYPGADDTWLTGIYRDIIAGNYRDINGFYHGFWAKRLQISVSLDIKPGSDQNSINLSSAGVVPVAILSTADFNAPTEVNPGTITLAGAKVKLIGKSAKYLCQTEDVNGDALNDLVCQVETIQFLIEPGDSIAVLEGETFDGTPIRGEDSVRIVPE